MQGGGIRRAIHKQQTIINEYLESPNGRLTGCPVCLSRCRLASIPYLCMMPLLSMITPKIIFYFLSLPALVGKQCSKGEWLQLTALNFLPWDFLLVKKLEIKKTKTTFIISVLKVVY